MSEYGVETARRFHGSDSNSDRFARGNRIAGDNEESHVQALNGTKIRDNSSVVAKEQEDKYYQYLLRKSSSKRKSASDTTLGITNGNASRAERSFGQANNLSDRSVVDSGHRVSGVERQTNYELSNYRSNVYPNKRGQDLNRERKSSFGAATEVDRGIQSYDRYGKVQKSENFVDRRPRVKDLRSLFDSRTSNEEYQGENRVKEANIVKGITLNKSSAVSHGNIDQTTSNILLNNKDPIKTNKTKGNELFARDKVHVESLSNVQKNTSTKDFDHDGSKREHESSGLAVPMERIRVFSDPGTKWIGKGRQSLVGTTDSTSSKGPALRTPIKLSKEEAEGAWRLSLAASKRKTEESSSDEDSDSSLDSQGKTLDNSRHRVSDRQVLKMLHEKHPTGELKKMFDGPEAFDETTRRQSFYEFSDQDPRYDARDVAQSPSPTGMKENHANDNNNDSKMTTSESNPDEQAKDLFDRYIDSGPTGNHGLITKGDIDVSQFITEPSSQRLVGNSVIGHKEAQEPETVSQEDSDGQASSYKSMYNQFLQKEGVENVSTPSPPKSTYKYTKETYRRELYSTESEPDSEILGETVSKDNVVNEFYAMEDTNRDESLEVEHEPLHRLSSTDSSAGDAEEFHDMMPKEYDDETQDDDPAHDSSSPSYMESDVGSAADTTSPKPKSNFQFNFVLKHQDDLKASSPETAIPGKLKKKREVKFDEKLHSVHETYHPLDYERGNDDIDPVSSSAEWELEKRVEKMDVFSVDLDKGGKLTHKLGAPVSLRVLVVRYNHMCMMYLCLAFKTNQQPAGTLKFTANSLLYASGFFTV